MAQAKKIVAVMVVVTFAIIGIFGEAFASSKKNRPTTEVEAIKNSPISSRSSSRSSISRSGNSNVTVQNIISSGSSRSGRSYGGGRSYRSHRGRGNNGDEMLYGIGGALIGGVLGYVIGNQNRQQPVVVQPAAYPQQNPPQATATAEVVINGMRCVHAGYDQTGAAILRCSR